MSVSVMAWVWTHSPASGNDRLALLCLADEADDDGANCYPSTARIAAKCNIDKGTVLDVIRRLEAAGEVIVKRPERYGRGRHNRYVLTLGRDVDELRRRAGWEDDTAENGGEAPPIQPGDNPPENGGDSPPLNDKNGGATPPKRWRDTPEKVVPAPPDPKTDPYRPPDARARLRRPAPPSGTVTVVPPAFEPNLTPRPPAEELVAQVRKLRDGAIPPITPEESAAS